MPVAAQLASTLGVDDQGVGRRQGGDLGVGGPRMRDEPEAEVLVDRGPIERRAKLAGRQDRLDLGPEEELFASVGVVERFLAQPVAAQHQAAARRVPQGEGEHSSQARYEVGPVLLVEVDQNLGVALGAEAVARLEVAPQLDVIVDLAVHHDPDRLVLVGQRLGPGLEIDDAEAA
jgi:hypothetical protein